MGHFSWSILDQWKGKRLYSVDPWAYQENVSLDASNIEQSAQEAAYQTAKQVLAPFGSRSEIIRDFSVNAAKRFENNTLDFVYIDARHDYRSARSDLDAWYPKVRPGGIIAGHDYKNSFVRLNLVEVKRAVDFFFMQKEEVKTTIDDNLPSWYVIKEAQYSTQV